MFIFRALLATLLLARFAAAQERVSFPTEDGGVVYADRYGQGDRGVVLAHGGRFNKENWEKQAQVLAKAGFRVLAIDFRGYGQSHGPQSKSGFDGVEYGVLAAWTDRPAEKMKGRKLFIVARDDANADGPRLPKIRANYEKAVGPKVLVILDGSAHAQFLFATDQGERLMREILRFLSEP
jgi:pimeloyl-ACP methyl ester carboxylesterase